LIGHNRRLFHTCRRGPSPPPKAAVEQIGANPPPPGRRSKQAAERKFGGLVVSRTEHALSAPQAVAVGERFRRPREQGARNPR